jgi:hypothetical protein
MKNCKTVSLTLILSEFDFETLCKSSNEVGLKKSEYLRLIIQAIGAGSKESILSNTINGYGYYISDQIAKNILKDISEKLNNSLQNNFCTKNLRNKRIKK